MKYIKEASAINLFKNAKTLKLNDKGFGTLDMVFDKAEKAKDDLNTFKRRVELVFGLKDKKEINRFIKKNVNWPELTEFLENIKPEQQKRGKMKTYKEYIKVRDVSNLPDVSDTSKFNVDDLNVFLNEATTEGILKSGEAECFEKTFLALIRIGGRAAVLVVKTIVKLLKKAGIGAGVIKQP